MKVKIFDDTNIGALERKINTFFEENHVLVLNIKYSTCYKGGGYSSYVNYSAMIMYDEVAERKMPEMKPPMWK